MQHTYRVMTWEIYFAYFSVVKWTNICSCCYKCLLQYCWGKKLSILYILEKISHDNMWENKDKFRVIFKFSTLYFTLRSGDRDWLKTVSSFCILDVNTLYYFYINNTRQKQAKKHVNKFFIIPWMSNLYFLFFLYYHSLCEMYLNFCQKVHVTHITNIWTN